MDTQRMAFHFLAAVLRLLTPGTHNSRRYFARNNLRNHLARLIEYLLRIYLKSFATERQENGCPLWPHLNLLSVRDVLGRGKLSGAKQSGVKFDS